MTKNESTLDRVIRLVLAVVAVVLALVVGPGSAWGIVLWVVAAVAAVTAVTGFCALYRLVGINTCQVPAKR